MVVAPHVPPDSRPLHLAATTQHWGKLTLSLLWVYRGAVHPAVSGHMDACLTMTAWLVLKGSVTVTADGEKVSAHAGEWIFPKPVPRHQKFSPGAEILSVNARIEWPDGDPLFKKGLSLVLKKKACPELERIARRLERTVEKVAKTRFQDARLANARFDFTQFIELEKQVIIWCDVVYRTLTKAGLVPNLHQTGDPRIHGILERLDTWPLSEPFNVSVLAGRTGLSRSNLDRIAGRALGGSCKAYIDRRRLHCALQSLHDPHTSTKQIAIETGFRHSSSFVTWFKKKTGRYPGEMAARLV